MNLVTVEMLRNKEHAPLLDEIRGVRGPKVTYSKGTQYELNSHDANDLINQGAAKRVKVNVEPRQTKVMPEPKQKPSAKKKRSKKAVK